MDQVDPVPLFVALSGNRRTESAWVKTPVFDKWGAAVAKMLLNRRR
ncbi:hypothetical protein WHZ77_24645 [Bradyrhizobium sp. A5]